MFPFDKIKIDKSFIQSMTNHADSAAIVCAIAGLGRSLDIETTAEGVETAEQFVVPAQRRLPIGARISLQPAGPVVQSVVRSRAGRAQGCKGCLRSGDRTQANC